MCLPLFLYISIVEHVFGRIMSTVFFLNEFQPQSLFDISSPTEISIDFFVINSFVEINPKGPLLARRIWIPLLELLIWVYRQEECVLQCFHVPGLLICNESTTFSMEWGFRSRS